MRQRLMNYLAGKNHKNTCMHYKDPNYGNKIRNAQCAAKLIM